MRHGCRHPFLLSFNLRTCKRCVALVAGRFGLRQPCRWIMVPFAMTVTCIQAFVLSSIQRDCATKSCSDSVLGRKLCLFGTSHVLWTTEYFYGAENTFDGACSICNCRNVHSVATERVACSIEDFPCDREQIICAVETFHPTRNMLHGV